MERTQKALGLLLASLCILLAVSTTCVSARSSHSRVGPHRQHATVTSTKAERNSWGITHERKARSNSLQDMKVAINLPQQPAGEAPAAVSAVVKRGEAPSEVNDATDCTLERLDLELGDTFLNEDLQICGQTVVELQLELIQAFEEETASLAELRACLLALFLEQRGFPRRARSLNLHGANKKPTRRAMPRGQSALPQEIFDFLESLSADALESYTASCQQDVKNLNNRITQQEVEDANCWNDVNSLLQQISDRLANVQVYNLEIESCQEALFADPTKREERQPEVAAQAQPTSQVVPH